MFQDRQDRPSRQGPWTIRWCEQRQSGVGLLLAELVEVVAVELVVAELVVEPVHVLVPGLELVPGPAVDAALGLEPAVERDESELLRSPTRPAGLADLHTEQRGHTCSQHYHPTGFQPAHKT